VKPRNESARPRSRPAAEKQKLEATEERRRIEQQARKAREAIARTKAENERIEAERKKALEAKRKADQERKRAETAQRKREAELAMQEALAAEQAEFNRERDRLLRTQLAEYVGQIKAKVESRWTRPKAAPTGLKCTLRVSQIPGGTVVNVQVLEGSGHVAFDKSVEAAVWNSSPLPPPKDESLFSRELIFEFDPED
jgi:colicin import membrane protein